MEESLFTLLAFGVSTFGVAKGGAFNFVFLGRDMAHLSAATMIPETSIMLSDEIYIGSVRRMWFGDAYLWIHSGFKSYRAQTDEVPNQSNERNAR